MDLGEIEWDFVDWIDVAQNTDQWRALVSTVMNLGFHRILGSSRVAAQWAATQDRLSSLNSRFRLTRQMSCSLLVSIRRIKMRLFTTAYVTHYT
jgi:hypothetical protein